MRLCTHQNCFRKHFAKGLCEAHYARQRAGIPLDHPLRRADGMAKVFVEMALTSNIEGCILWPYNKTPAGYGSALLDGTQQNVHRYICLRLHGKPPSDKHVAAHLCDAKDCVNPRHIIWMTQRANIQDASDNGLRVPPIKLTDEQVAEIRRRYDSEGPTKLAKQYSVHKGTIYRIATNRRRASV